MKQRIKITAIIKDSDDRILLLKRKDGDFELPQGKISVGEQPEQCLSRILLDYFNLVPSHVNLLDVISYYESLDGRPIYSVFVLYGVRFYDNANINSLDNEEYRYLAVSENEDYTPLNNLTKSSEFILRILSQDKSSLTVLKKGQGKERLPTEGEFVMFADGGSRGNPGASAAAFVIYKNGNVVNSGGDFLGITNNSQAEYHSLRLGLEAAISSNIKNLTVKLDNLMVVGQMNGIYKVKNRELWPIYTKIKNLSKKFDYLSIQHVKREYNVLADSKVNEILDSATK